MKFVFVTLCQQAIQCKEMEAPRGQFRALSNDRNLRRFVVQARPTGRQLGTGSYGTVEEVWTQRELCTGCKLIVLN